MDANTTSGNLTEISFELIFQNEVMKYLAVPVAFIFTLFICCLCAGIIWYEQYGSDLKRILINRLVSSFVWVALYGHLLIVLPDLVLYLYRPLPVWLCYLNILIRNAMVVNAFLLLDAIIIVRYIFIFWLKDPLGFDDTFWSAFINVCSFVVSLFTQSVFILLPGRQPLQFYLCSNQISEEINDLAPKINWTFLLLFITSGLLHLIITFRIGAFKSKQGRSIRPFEHSEQTRLNDISSIEKRSLSDVVTNILTITGAIVLFCSPTAINWPKPRFFTQFPNQLLVYYFHFVFTFLTCGPIIVAFYVRNPAMRKSIRRELTGQLNPILDNIQSWLMKAKTQLLSYQFGNSPQI